ncbi:MAG: lipopolysaccharide biosynthesis protein [Promethearchaeota archaeon]
MKDFSAWLKRYFKKGFFKKNTIIVSFILLILITISGTSILNRMDRDLPHIRRAGDVSASGSKIINVLFITDLNFEGKNDNNQLLSALTLDPIINLTILNSSEFHEAVYFGLKKDGVEINSNLSDFNVIILGDFTANYTKEAQSLTEFSNNGGGILVLMGPNLQDNPQILYSLNISTNVSHGVNFDQGVIVENSSSQDPIVQNIEWNSAPSAVNISIAEPSENSRVLVEVEIFKGLQKIKYPLIIASDEYGMTNSSSTSEGRVILVTLWEDARYNFQFRSWFYYNYFYYVCIYELAQNTLGAALGELKTYADWDYSPVPHRSQQFFIGILEVSLILIAIFSFLRSYKKSKKVPQDVYLKDFAEKMKKEMERIRKKKKEEELKREAEIKEEWERVGTHRQFSGFLFGFFSGFLLLIPQVILTGFVLPRYIMPYPSIAGMYDWAKNFFQALWTVFDLGTSVALAKYFAEYRIEKPEKAIRYVQIFVWWQMITGCIQTTLVAFMGSLIFPHTYLAHMSYLFIFNSLIQFPGWFQVLIFTFQGMQRTDYQLIGNIAQVAVFDLLFQYLFIIIFRHIFAGMPAYGDAFGALIGYSIGQWVGDFFTFLFTLYLFRKLGYHQSTLFRIDFGVEELKETMIYGAKFVVGAVLVPIVHMLQALFLSWWVFAYNQEWGLFSMIYQITQINALVNLYTQGMLSGISEAHGNNAPKLLELNIIQGIRISNYMSFFIVSSLAVILAPFVTGVMGEYYAPGVKYIPLLLLRTTFEPLTWLGDKAFQGTGYTKQMSISWVIEQGSRVVMLILFMYLIPLQMFGLLIAWLISLILKVIYQWATIRGKIIRFHWYWWKSFIGFGLSALVSALIIYIYKAFAFYGDPLTGILLFAVVFFVFLPIYSFFTGFFGGWDRNTLKEFDRASEMVNGVKIFARQLYKFAEFGAKHSLFNLNDKFNIQIYGDAIEEAKILTAKKKELII